MKKLKCHCGKIEAEINLPSRLEKIIRCNCSICKRKGAIMSMVKNEDFKLTKGQDKLKVYNFILRLLSTTSVPIVASILITTHDPILY